MGKLKLGFCICGSFCTISKAIEQMEKLSEEYEIVPIISPVVDRSDTRFGTEEDLKKRITEITGCKIIKDIVEAEPIGPKNMTDIMLIAPATGNTMAKLAAGIVDTAVTMAAKSHLRNARPLVLAPATNDALGAAAKNIGALMNYRNYYFVPFKEDDRIKKPRSMVADFERIPETLTAALNGKQIQPIVF